jgi:hypothetical protein
MLKNASNPYAVVRANMTQVDELLDGLQPLLKRRRDEDQARNRQQAFEFKAFSFFSPQENSLSRILSDLLNPRGCHGQGKIFLDRFLECINHPELAAVSDRAAVRYQDTSYWAEGGGIPDITVDLEDFLICIENKPFARDQPGQLERYRRSMEKRRRQNFCLVYLSGTGDPPTSLAPQTRPDLENARRFRIIPYATALVQWLEDCRNLSAAPKVRWFLDEFVDYLKFTFRDGGLMSSEKSVILQAAFQNSERLGAALLIGSAYEDIKSRLVKTGFERVRGQLEVDFGSGWKFNIGDEGEPNGWYLHFRKDSWPASMCLGFGRDNVNGELYLYAGRWDGSSRRVEIDRTLKEALDSGIGTGRKETTFCCWWRLLDKYTNWNSISTLEKLAQGDEPVEYVVTLLRQLREEGEAVLDAEVRRRSASGQA